MQYIEAPSQDKPEHPAVFLAGGITDCPDWQAELCALLRPLPITVYNPRRRNFPIHDPDAAVEQIRWEYERLHTADILSFWFSVGSLNPIVLFEYGAALERDQYIVAGCHLLYARRNDVLIQTALYHAAHVRDEQKKTLAELYAVCYSIQELADDIKACLTNLLCDECGERAWKYPVCHEGRIVERLCCGCVSGWGIR